MWVWVKQLFGFVTSAKQAAWSLFSGRRHRRHRLLMVGLDNSGKSTLGHLLERDLIIATEPTMHPLKQHFAVGDTLFETMDLGGHNEALRLWKSYYEAALDGIIFMVDASAPERFPDAAKQLAEILTTNAAHNIPVAVVGNKIDVKTAVSPETLAHALHIHASEEDNQRPIRLFMISVVKRCNHTEPFVWLSKMVLKDG